MQNTTIFIMDIIVSITGLSLYTLNTGICCFNFGKYTYLHVYTYYDGV